MNDVPSAATTRRHLRVILVDENQTALESVSDFIDDLGFAAVVATASTPDQAVGAALTPADLVLIDLEVGGRPGALVARRMLDLQPHLVIGFLTARDTAGGLDGESDIAAFLANKSDSPRELIGRLASLATERAVEEPHG